MVKEREMTKRDFLEELKIALVSRVSAQEATEHLNFYEDYINTQVRMGRVEEDVLAELGEPRLLVRNIAESKKYASDGSKKNYENTGHYAGDNETENAYSRNKKTVGIKIPGWLWGILIILIVILFFALCFSIFSFLAPVLVPLILVLILIRIWQKNG